MSATKDVREGKKLTHLSMSIPFLEVSDYLEACGLAQKYDIPREYFWDDLGDQHMCW